MINLDQIHLIGDLTETMQKLLDIEAAKDIPDTDLVQAISSLNEICSDLLNKKLNSIKPLYLHN